MPSIPPPRPWLEADLDERLARVMIVLWVDVGHGVPGFVAVRGREGDGREYTGLAPREMGSLAACRATAITHFRGELTRAFRGGPPS